MAARRRMRVVVVLASALCGVAASAAESFETAPVRPRGGGYVPPPFTPLATEKQAVRCLGRRYDLAGAVPIPTVGERRLVRDAAFVLNGQRLAPPPLSWRLETPAVAIAERSWRAGDASLTLRQTVEYDGFITADLTLLPLGQPATVRELTLRLDYLPEASVLYHIPVFRPTWAGLWPREMKIDKPIVGVWGGDDAAGFASYVATFRHWRSPGTKVLVSKGDDGAGRIDYRVVAEPTRLEAPVTYRFGFIATPVRPPERRHMQLYAVQAVRGAEKLADRILIWGGLSDHYATFRTNARDNDAAKLAMVRKARAKATAVLAYTTYAHVEDGAVDVPKEWALADAKGRVLSRSIGGANAHLKRVFLCPGSRSWVDWKLRDLEAAVDRYGIDGFYVDTSYIIMPCANALHGHGWLDAKGERQSDCLTWSMREVWRRAYELLCRKRGRATIYAHHKSGCPAALAAFTTAFCDGEQYTGQSIRNCTLDAFRAEDAGRHHGPLALFINEYYRSANYGLREKAQHHNPTESLMLCLLHDVMPMGYPGYHPVRELIALRDDLGIADAAWTPYYARDAAWRADGAGGLVVSSYRTARGDTLLVVGNPGFEPARARLVGPKAARDGRTFVAIDVFARLGRGSEYTPGYRWEAADPGKVEVGARSLALFAFVREPRALARFAAQHGFFRVAASPRRRPVPKGARLVSNFDDPDWTLANDDGHLGPTRREPVDTARALHVAPKPHHASAALLRHFADPQDWRAFTTVTLWVRPERPLPVRSLEVRLRNANTYGPPATLASHKLDSLLPPGRWTQLRYAFRDVPREHVQILRIYYHRGELCSGPFDLDEIILHPADTTPPAGANAGKPKGGDENKPVPD